MEETAFYAVKMCQFKANNSEIKAIFIVFR